MSNGLSWIIAGLMILTLMGCKKKENKAIPSVTTGEVSQVTQTTALVSGFVSDDGGAPVTARGICWSTRQDPTTGDDKTSDGEGLGTFTSQLTGLNAAVPYYVRAYATNSAGTAYGDTVSFVRILPDSIEYTLYDPPIGITSVRYMNPPTLQYDCYQPVPIDSAASYYLDLDQDGTPEFRIFIRQWYEFHSASNPCYNFQYYSAIYSIRAGDSVAVINNNTEDCAIVLNEGAGISESLIYAERGVTVRRYWMAFPCNLDNLRAGGYYGFKILINGKTMFGWLRLSYNGSTHTITLHEMAYDHTAGHLIWAGQKE
ncbi:MAG: hypothetical protein EOM90_09570 [Alphaproteobacteria bacterium]|nr:hypothetical protein [Alphaproteobacteria bacterium]